MGETIDILINCGGIQRRFVGSFDMQRIRTPKAILTLLLIDRTPAENFPDEDWEEVIQVNMNTVFTLCRDVGRHMLESRGGVAGEEAKPEGAADANPRGRGKIINVASLVSYQGGITVPAYAAAKHGVLGITKALSNEWVSKGVNVNAVAPGKYYTCCNALSSTS